MRRRTIRRLVLLLTLIASSPALATTVALTPIGGSTTLEVGETLDIEVTHSLDAGEGFYIAWASALIITAPEGIDEASVFSVSGSVGTPNGGLATAIHYQFNAGPDPTFCGASCFGGLGLFSPGIVDEGGGVYRLGVYGGVVSTAGFIDQSPQVLARVSLTALQPGAFTIGTGFAGYSALNEGCASPNICLPDPGHPPIDWGSLQVTVVPEPSTALLLALGLLGLGAQRRRT